MPVLWTVAISQYVMQLPTTAKRVIHKNYLVYWQDSERPDISRVVALFSSQNFSRFLITSNFAANTLSIKYRRKQKLITQFAYKSRDESFDPS